MANRHERRAGKAQQRRPRHPTAPHLAVVPNLLNNEWDTFREMVLAPDAPDIQLSEMRRAFFGGAAALFNVLMRKLDQIGRASCRERVCQYVTFSGVAGSLKKKTNIHMNNLTLIDKTN